MMVIETDHSVNFVDENDRFVGYELEIQCCESSGWDTNVDSLDRYVFVDEDPVVHIKDEGQTNSVVFKIRKMGYKHKDETITLWNNHNGYYSHGFRYGELQVTGTESI